MESEKTKRYSEEKIKNINERKKDESMKINTVYQYFFRHIKSTGFYHKIFFAKSTINILAIIRVNDVRTNISLYARILAVVRRTANALIFDGSRKNGSPKNPQMNERDYSLNSP